MRRQAGRILPSKSQVTSACGDGLSRERAADRLADAAHRAVERVDRPAGSRWQRRAAAAAAAGTQPALARARPRRAEPRSTSHLHKVLHPRVAAVRLRHFLGWRLWGGAAGAGLLRHAAAFGQAVQRANRRLPARSGARAPGCSGCCEGLQAAETTGGRVDVRWGCAARPSGRPWAPSAMWAPWPHRHSRLQGRLESQMDLVQSASSYHASGRPPDPPGPLA